MEQEEFNLDLILQGCRKAKRRSQKKLYMHFYGYAMSICLRYSKNREEASEILNDAFLKVFSNILKYDSKQAFKPWFRKIIINCAIDYYRKNKNGPILVELSQELDRTVYDRSSVKIGEDTDMLPIIQRLTPAYRMVFNLYVMEEYKHQEIAKIMGISESTSRSNLLRAKEKLRNMIGDSYPGKARVK